VTALLSHSCLANTKTLLEPGGRRCEIRATRDIAAGEEVTKQYVSPLETTNMRRAKLREGWYFDCECERCRDPAELGALASATKCMRCAGEGLVLPRCPLEPEADWICDACGFKVTL